LGRKRKSHRHLPPNIYIRRGSYQLRYRNGHAVTFISLDTALQAWAGEYGDVVGETLHHVILSYRAKILPQKAPSTQKEYGKALDRLDAVFGPNRVKDIRPTHVYQYQAARSQQGASVIVNRDIATLSGVFNHAVELGHIDFNPCRQVRRRPEKPRTRYVTDEELAIVYALASEWMKRAIRMACLTGIRLGDLCRIGPENITDDGFLYQQGKTGRRMLIEWVDGLQEAAQSPPVSYEGFTSAWQRLMKKALLNGLHESFRFHDLRAKAGSEALDWRILGHTERSTFERIYNRKPIRILTAR